MDVAELADASVTRASWARDAATIAWIRRAVFIEEQAVPESLEWEAIDPDCDWFVARVGAEAVGVARLTTEGRIGRMAVLTAWRGKGLGSALLRAALARARELGRTGVVLSAQVRAIPFYARFGFVAEGLEYMDAGIPHRKMFLSW
jgi:predicted GNAT family N-acyltransferase